MTQRRLYPRAFGKQLNQDFGRGTLPSISYLAETLNLLNFILGVKVAD